MSTEAVAAPTPIPANDFAALWREVGADVGEAVGRVGASGWYILGREVERFERDLAAWWGVEEVVGCASGLDAIELALRALELPAGSRVLTTPLSAYATALAIIRAGHLPVFADVDASGLLDVGRCREIVAADDGIRVVLPVHLFGHAADLDGFESLCREHRVALVEDCAQAVGARSHGRAAGSVGIASATSFYPTKNLGALGDGGALATGDIALADRVRALRDYGQTSKYVHAVPGLNSRLDELHAAILRMAMLPRLTAWTERRSDLAVRYLAGIDSEHVAPVPSPPGSESVWHLFPVLVTDAARRDPFVAHLKSLGIAVGVHYPILMTDQAALATSVGLPDLRGPVPNARRFAATEASLPISPFVTDGDADRVIDACNEWRG